MLRVSSAQSVRSRCFYPPSTLDITPNSIANTSIERAYVITWQESNLSQLLHLNFYFVTWNDNLCHLQLLTRWDNSQSIQPPLLNRTPILINMYFNEDQRTNTTKKHVSKYIRLKSSNTINYSTLNSEHNWQDLCIRLKSQSMCTFSNHNQIRGSPIFNPIFADASS
jgi:hypothetical protein